MADSKLPLPKFQAALREDNYGLRVASWYRYQRGIVPDVIHWLIHNPSLLAALAEDAKTLQVMPSRQVNHLQEVA